MKNVWTAYYLGTLILTGGCQDVRQSEQQVSNKERFESIKGVRGDESSDRCGELP